MDAKKALGGYGSSAAGGPAGAGGGYMSPYLDFKKSPLFSGCYNYTPHLPPHLPFIPFGYHGMMNLAVHAGSQLAAMQRRGDDLQRFTMTTGIRPPNTDSGTPSQRYCTSTAGSLSHWTTAYTTVKISAYPQIFCCESSIFGPILWGHSGPLCHAMSLSLSSSSSLWTSMRRRRATVAACDSSDTW